MDKLVLSSLGHTWILDLDGTLIKHNGYKIDGSDSFLPGTKKFLNSIPDEDMIIFITARTSKYREETIKFLADNKIKYDHIIFNAPFGERILLNDKKNSGLLMAKCINLNRDEGIRFSIEYNEML